MSESVERGSMAAELTRVLASVDFPLDRDGLVDYAKDRGETRAAELLRELPAQTYHDAAEVTHALSSIRGRPRQHQHQPSRLAGRRATQASSAARIARLFRGIEFPVTGAELRRWASDEATEQEQRILEQFGAGPYRNMSEVAREFGRLRSKKPRCD